MNIEIDGWVTIGTILGAIRAGHKTEHLAISIGGISRKSLLRALKNAGYKYSNAAPKGWHYFGEGAEPTDKSIFDYVGQSNKSVNSDNTNVTIVSPTVHPQFAREEVEDLVAMLQEWRMKKQANQIGNKELESIYYRIKQLPQGDKT